jgi:hypothetical protein
LKKRRLELERERKELRRKRHGLGFEEEELEIAGAGEQLEVGRDDNEVVSFLRVMSEILGNSTTDTQNLMLERKLSLPPSITGYNRSIALPNR